MTTQETHTLRRLDLTVEADGSAIIGTNYGDITVRKLNTGIYYAGCDEAAGFAFTSGCASTAFLKLADKLKEAEVK